MSTQQDSEAMLCVRGLSKAYGAESALKPISFDVHAGEFFAVLGPSGCGKSTLLRLLAGLEYADQGTIVLAGQDITAWAAHERPVNMMFQSYALFPHLTVAGNVAFGLKQEGLRKAEIARRVEEALAMVQLNAYAKRKPAQLSGGQCQRVALARALVKRPRLLLLDEPLAALDKQLREKTQQELRRIQQNLGMTFIVVTHDQHEAMAMADRIAVMANGEIAQVGTPAQIYERPRSRYVADFVGDVNLLRCTVVDSDSHGTAWLIRLHSPGWDGDLTCVHDHAILPGHDVWLAIRPEQINMSVVRSARDQAAATSPQQHTMTPLLENGSTCQGEVRQVTYLGSALMHQVQCPGGFLLKVKSKNNMGAFADRITQGMQVAISWPLTAAVLIDENNAPAAQTAEAEPAAR